MTTHQALPPIRKLGAAFGLSTLWTAVITYPLMYAVQEMCGRIGIATSQGLAGVIVKHYPRAVAYLILLVMFPALVINIAANLSGMSTVAALLIPFIPAKIFCLFFSVFLYLMFAFSSYKKIVNRMKYLCLTLIIYLFIPFFENTDWEKTAISILKPDIQWDANYLAILVAIFGTTISPYLFFWQASLCVEETKHEKKLNENKMTEMKTDVNAGMLFSNVLMFFIILSTGTVLHPAGITDIKTLDQASKALEPLAGEWAYLFFSIGVLASGFLAIPVLAGCAGFMFGEVFGWKRGLAFMPREAKKFYTVTALAIFIALLINLIGIDPMASLILAAMLYGLIAPFILVIIMLICNNSRIMKGYVNGWKSNAAGLLALLLMSASVIALFITL